MWEHNILPTELIASVSDVLIRYCVVVAELYRF